MCVCQVSCVSVQLSNQVCVYQVGCVSVKLGVWSEQRSNLSVCVCVWWRLLNSPMLCGSVLHHTAAHSTTLCNTLQHSKRGEVVATVKSLLQNSPEFSGRFFRRWKVLLLNICSTKEGLNALNVRQGEQCYAYFTEISSLWMGYAVLLTECRTLLMGCAARFTETRALWMGYAALLME